MSDVDHIMQKASAARHFIELGERKLQEARSQMEQTLGDAENRIIGLSMSGQEAADFASCDYSTMYRHKKAGKLKSLLISDVIAWKRKYKPGRDK